MPIERVRATGPTIGSIADPMWNTVATYGLSDRCCAPTCLPAPPGCDTQRPSFRAAVQTASRPSKQRCMTTVSIHPPGRTSDAQLGALNRDRGYPSARKRTAPHRTMLLPAGRIPDFVKEKRQHVSGVTPAGSRKIEELLREVITGYVRIGAGRAFGSSTLRPRRHPVPIPCRRVTIWLPASGFLP